MEITSKNYIELTLVDATEQDVRLLINAEVPEGWILTEATGWGGGEGDEVKLTFTEPPTHKQ